MKTIYTLLICTIFLLLVLSCAGAVRYVDGSNTNASPPFTNWATAARTIQDAIDIADAGDEIVVTNGVYASGGRAVFGTTTNRVAVTKPMTVRSVKGSKETLIMGYQVPGTTNGNSAVRCVYLTNGAVLVGFTLTNGAVVGHSCCGAQSDYSGGGVWCESGGATLSNCTISGNSAGGAYQGTLNNCVLTSNFADYGGGASWSSLNNCTLTGNSAFESGGGVVYCLLSNCTLMANVAEEDGGGADRSLLKNCTLASNSASFGGGASRSTLNNCVLTGNRADVYGGGASDSALNNCTITGNAAWKGGGVSEGSDDRFSSELDNCIVYYNTAWSGQNTNYLNSTLVNSCTIPLPENGLHNITDEPRLASDSHLSIDSPCRGAGNPLTASGVDIDGEPWATLPSIGCDEIHTGTLTGPLSVSIEAGFTSVATGFAMDFRAQIGGRLSNSRWDFGDGTVISNRPYASHGWATPGEYQVVLRAYNETYAAGVSATVTVHVVEAIYYVVADSAGPMPPYSSWATAARSIQDAVDATIPGALILVSNGVYQTGGRAVTGTLTNRVAVTKPITVRSLNGPAATVIEGYQVPGVTNGDRGVRCVYLANGAILVGFTLTNGAALSSSGINTRVGGGVLCESVSATVSNCAITGNSAGFGGGAAYGTLNNCTITANSAASGGGASGSSLNNCTVTGNSDDGVAFDCTLNNCIVYYNTASFDNRSNYSPDCMLNYSCTTPLPVSGRGNITNAPLFVSQAGGNLRLQTNSACINAGRNAYAPTGPDLDGNRRIVGGTVDIGAYEFQAPQSTISYAWLQQYGLATDGSADDTDPDGDHSNNYQEWRVGTNPTNAASALRLRQPLLIGSNLVVTWESVAAHSYFLEASTDLSAPVFFQSVAATIPGQPGTTTFTHTNAASTGPRFYRVGVEQ